MNQLATYWFPLSSPDLCAASGLRLFLSVTLVNTPFSLPKCGGVDTFHVLRSSPTLSVPEDLWGCCFACFVARSLQAFQLGFQGGRVLVLYPPCVDGSQFVNWSC